MSQLCREEYENDQNIRQALLQDMLRGVSDNTYREALQNYMETNGMFRLLDALNSRDIPPEAVGIYPGMTAERVVVCGWVTVMAGKGYSSDEVPKYGPLEERLLVVTNYQMYLLKHPHLTWKPCENCSPDKFCPRGPDLDRTIRFDCVERMTYGFTGQWFHLGLSSAGDNNSRQFMVEERSAHDPPESLHVYCPRRQLCSRLCGTIKASCDDWERHNTTSLGANVTYEYPPPGVDVDMAMRTAISSIVHFARVSGTGDGGKDSGKGTKAEDDVDTKTVGGTRKSGDSFASARGDRYHDAILATFVKVYKGAAGDIDKGKDFEDKLLILTKKQIIMADFDPKCWSFPINWSLRREMVLQQHAMQMRDLEDIINRKEKEKKQEMHRAEKHQVSVGHPL